MAKTYYATATASSNVTDGSDFNSTLESTQPGTPTAQAKTNIGGGTTDLITHTYTNLVNEPNLTTWDSGNYTAYMYCTTIGANVTFTISIVRVDSAGVVVSVLGTSGSFNTAALHSYTYNMASPLSVNAGDRLQFRANVSRAASHGTQTIEFTVGDATNVMRIDTPLTISTPTRNRIHVT